MRRLTVAWLLLGLAACTGGATSLPPPPSPSSPRVTDPGAGLFCDQLVGMSQQVSGLLAGTTTDFAGLAKLYASLRTVAPPAIRPTVDDVVAALTEATDPSKLADFDRRATADTTALTAYARANC